MGQFSRKNENYTGIEGFLQKQLQEGDLFRGNKNYIAEALLSMDYRASIWIVCRDFIPQIHDFEDRINEDNNDKELAREVTYRPFI